MNDNNQLPENREEKPEMNEHSTTNNSTSGATLQPEDNLNSGELNVRLDAARRFCSNPFRVQANNIEELLNLDYYEI